MMLRLIYTAIALVALASSIGGTANGGIHGSIVVPPACPYGSTYADGCAGAPVGGSVQEPGFFTTYAPQSGQHYSVRPPWNVAGVDYAVGIPAATIAAGLADPTVSPPTGCSVTNNSGVYSLHCQQIANLTINGYDFSLHGCISLTIGNYQVSGTITIENSRFVYGPNCSTSGMLTVQTPSANLIIEDSEFDGDAPDYPSAPVSNLIGPNVAGGYAVLIQYTSCRRVQARCITTNKTGGSTYQFNYFEGMSYYWDSGAVPAHGEYAITESTTLVANLDYLFNTMLQPISANGGDVTALNSLTENGDGIYRSDCKQQHNGHKLHCQWVTLRWFNMLSGNGFWLGNGCLTASFDFEVTYGKFSSLQLKTTTSIIRGLMEMSIPSTDRQLPQPSPAWRFPVTSR